MGALKNHVKFLIVGAGPTGLGAAYRLKELKENDFLVIEKQATAGGLARSFSDPKGFYWDIGVHVIHSHYEYFDKALSTIIKPENWAHKNRAVFAKIGSSYIPYPVQYNIHFLPEELWKACLFEFEKIVGAKRIAKNFAEWLRCQFGETLNSIFLEPYNKKVWGFSLDKLSAVWVGARVSL